MQRFDDQVIFLKYKIENINFENGLESITRLFKNFQLRDT